MLKVLLIPIVALLFSCEQERSQINYNKSIDTTSVIDNGIKDTTKLLVSELPIKFDSTDLLLFTIELVDLQKRGGYSKIGSYSYSDADIPSNYFDGDDLTGDFINIVFQDKMVNERKLTDKKIRIRRINFLRDIFKTTKTGYLLYSITDRDSNGDKELNDSDLEALYISKIDGTDFKKLTKELHEFYDCRLIKGENRVYFRTLEDKNKDGELTNKDKFHYFFIDFSVNKYSLIEYNPVKIFE